MRKLIEFVKILTDVELTSRIYIYMSTASKGNEYDNFENNLTYTNLNPVVIKGYVKTVSPEALIWKQYGLHEMGMVQVVCEDKYYNHFTLSNKIVIDSVEYQVFKSGTGQKTLIQKQPGRLIKVLLSRNG